MIRPVSSNKPGLFGSTSRNSGGLSRFNSMNDNELNPYGNKGSDLNKTGSALTLKKNASLKLQSIDEYGGPNSARKSNTKPLKSRNTIKETNDYGAYNSARVVGTKSRNNDLDVKSQASNASFSS